MSRLFRYPPIWAACLGFAIFCFCVGLVYANPYYTNWIKQFDTQQLFISWQFYATSPWGFPLGLIQGFTYPFDSSIVYTAMLPWVAIFIKFLMGHDAGQIQFVGLWVLSCFVLQAFFAARLMMLITADRLLILLGAIFFTIAPIFVYRIQFHVGLGAQWAILASIVLYLLPAGRQKAYGWLALMVFLVGTHFYLLCMVLAVLLADSLRHYRQRVFGVSPLLFLCFTLGLVVFVAWVLGYFVVSLGGAAGDGLGSYAMNLLSPFNSLYVLPTLVPRVMPEDPMQYEGFNYLGLGGMALLMVALSCWRWAVVKAAMKKHIWLLLACVVLTILAVSYRVTFGPWLLFTVPLSDWLYNKLAILRSSGRLFWPVYYLIFFVSLTVVIRCFKTTTARYILLGVILVQLLDCAMLYEHFSLQHNDTWFYGVNHPVPSQYPAKFDYIMVGHHIKHVVMISPWREWSRSNGYGEFSPLAVKHHATYTMGYVSRCNQAQWRDYYEKLMAQYRAGDLKRNTLYIINKEPIPVLPKGFVYRDVQGVGVVYKSAE